MRPCGLADFHHVSSGVELRMVVEKHDDVVLHLRKSCARARSAGERRIIAAYRFVSFPKMRVLLQFGLLLCLEFCLVRRTFYLERLYEEP